MTYIENNSEKIADAICYTETETITFGNNITVSPSVYDYLDAKIRDTYDSLDILGTVIYDSNSKVVYSNNKRIIGTHSKDAILLKTLSNGSLSSEYKSNQITTDLQAERRENIDIVTVYVPIKNSNNLVIGAFSLSSNATQLKSLYKQHLYTSIAIIVCSILLISLVSLFFIMRETNELKRAYGLLTTLATTDALTELYNRRFYEAELARLSSSRRYPVGIIMIDLDGLKKTNDTYGHAMGDKLICKTAQILKHSFRVEDMVARTGGDEFIVILPETSAESLQLAVNRTFACMSDANKVEDGLKVAFSLGYEIAETEEELQGAIKTADLKIKVILSLKRTDTTLFLFTQFFE